MGGESVYAGARSICTVVPQWLGATVVLRCSGDLDMITAPTLERHIDDALSEQPAVLIVDLSAVDFLASQGMGVLIGTHDCIVGRVGFAVVAHGAATSRPMTLLGLHEDFPMYPTLDAALEQLGGRHHG